MRVFIIQFDHDAGLAAALKFYGEIRSGNVWVLGEPNKA